MEGERFKEEMSDCWKTVMTRLSNPWSAESEIHLQHIKEKMTFTSNVYDQDFAASYPPSLDLALPPNATQQPCTLFHPQGYQTVQRQFSKTVPEYPLE